MSGEDIPYQLRPNKFIDRQMFLELLSRLVVPRGLENYIYVSMGGRHLVDHHAVYNRLGVTAQYSFDQSENEVARQRFNKPTGAAICEELNSADLPSEIDTIFARFPRKKNLIVWLDYTNAARRTQLQEAVQTLIRLKHGDVFRITMNANPQTLSAGDAWQKAGSEGPGQFRAQRLRLQIPEFLPTDVIAISENDLPAVLARCIQLATNEATRLQPKLTFRPVLITSYKDTTRMLTAACVVTDRDEVEPFPAQLFTRWKFACRGWSDIQYISAPVLSTKEQYRLDAHLHQGPRKMLRSLKFLPAEDEEQSLQALKSYRSFHRYYPSFRHVED